MITGSNLHTCLRYWFIHSQLQCGIGLSVLLFQHVFVGTDWTCSIMQERRFCLSNIRQLYILLYRTHRNAAQMLRVGHISWTSKDKNFNWGLQTRRLGLDLKWRLKNCLSQVSQILPKLIGKSTKQSWLKIWKSQSVSSAISIQPISSTRQLSS